MNNKIKIAACIGLICLILTLSIGSTFALPADSKYITTPYGVRVNYKMGLYDNTVHATDHIVYWNPIWQSDYIGGADYVFFTIWDPSTNTFYPTQKVTCSWNGGSREYSIFALASDLNQDCDVSVYTGKNLPVNRDLYLVAFWVRFANDSNMVYSDNYLNGANQQLLETEFYPPNDRYDEGYADGKIEGIAEEQGNKASIVRVVGDIVSAPFTAISNMLNFEVLGVNIAGVVFMLITLGLIAVLLKKFLQ